MSPSSPTHQESAFKAAHTVSRSLSRRVVTKGDSTQIWLRPECAAERERRPRSFATRALSGGVAAKVMEMLRAHGKDFLAIGIMTLRVGTIQHTGMRKSEQSAAARIPKAAAAAGVPVPGGGTVELETSRSCAVDWSIGGAVGKEGEGAPDEEIFAIEYKVLKRDWSRMGRNIKLHTKVPDYKGDTTYAGKGDSDDEDEDDEDDEDGDTLAAGLEVVIVAGEDFFVGAVISRPKPQLDQ